MAAMRKTALVDLENSQEEIEDSEAGTWASTPTSGQQASEQNTQARGDAWVTRRNPVGEVTSLISSLYISDPEENEQSIAVEDNPSYLTLPTFMSITTELGTVTDRVSTLETDFRDSVISALNRVANIRDYIDKSIAAIEQCMVSTLKQFEEKLVECLQW